MLILAICVLMGHKVTAGRGQGKKSGEGSSRVGNTKKRKNGKVASENSQSEFDSQSLEKLPLGPSDAQRKKEMTQ